MSNVIIRPDLRTVGGEINDILYHQKYAGMLTIVYREGMRISGSLQLDNQFLSDDQKDEVTQFARDYVQSLVYAMDIPEFDIFVTYSSMENVISSDHVFEHEYDLVDDELFDDVERQEEAVFYELVIVDERRNYVEYHIYGKKRKLIAEAFMSIHGGDVIGEVNWHIRPSEEQIGHVTDLIVADFDEDEIDTFLMDVKFDGDTIAVEELIHEEFVADNGLVIDPNTDDYSVVLIRDDGDALTFEIRRQSHGGIPIGTATLDISQRHITGTIDFNEWESHSNREHIALLIMNEIDKELDYDTFNLTFMHQNELIDEMSFESEMDSVH